MDSAFTARSSGFSFLSRSVGAQEKRFHKAFQILQRAIANEAFPGCALAVTYRGELIAQASFGRFTYDSTSPLVTPSTIFDIASLTKVVATTTMAMILYERGLLDLESPLVAVIPEFGEGGESVRRAVSLRMLLSHSSGLPAHEHFYRHTKTSEALLQTAFASALKAAPDSRSEYSDVGFIVLGAALERLADEKLDSFCQREIFGPLAMQHTTFNPSKSIKASIPPTCAAETAEKRFIQGEVQDENAKLLGGVAGHAGLFSAAEDLALFAHTMLNRGHPILRPSTIELFTQRQSQPAGTSRTLGWDTPSAPSQSGKYYSASSYGHLGYTGTSLWIDPEKQLSITLLTNRTWPDSQNHAIKHIRPAFHDAVIEALEKSQ